MPPRRRDRPKVSSSSSSAASAADPAAPPRIAQPTAAPVAPQQKSLLFSAVRFAVVLAAFLGLYYRRNVAPPPPVRERALVRSDISYLDVLNEHSRTSGNTSQRNFPNHVLAYVTPWNSWGYEMAEQYGTKLTHISPVWYEVKSEGKKFVLDGRHNADLGWISRIRANGKSLVLPRVVLSGNPWDYLQKTSQMKKVITIIANECKEMEYDGVVLESWSVWAGYGGLHDAEFRNKALHFVNKLGHTLHSLQSAANPLRHLELVYVIPALRGEEIKEADFGPNDLQALHNSVDGFSLMTYDYSGPHSPGPNAPLHWVRLCLRRLLGDDASHLASKIFLGINFYGNDFILSQDLGGGPVIGRNYLSLLEKHKPVLQWEEKSSEHLLVYSENKVKHVVFYPSLMSVSLRIDEARAFGAGISIWEIGQGLEYFFDLF